MTTTDEQELQRQIRNITFDCFEGNIDHQTAAGFILNWLEAQKQRWQIEARIDELTHVRMGHYAGVTEIFREGKAVTASERLKHLKSQLPSSDNQERKQ